MFGIKCNSCGATNKKGSKFCSECGFPLSDMVCSNCGKPLLKTSNFCPECGASLHAPIGSTSTVSPEPADLGKISVWKRRPDDFAHRFEVSDIKGIFSKKLTVEPGTKALFIQGGRFTGELLPGTYEVGGLKRALMDLNFAEKATVVLVDDSDVPVNFAIGGLRTKESFPAGVQGKMVVNVDNAALFLTNFMKGREHVAVTDIGLLVKNELLNVLQSKIKDVSFEDLYGNLGLKKEVEQDVEYNLKTTLNRLGMQLIYLPYFDYDESCWKDIIQQRAEFVRDNILKREQIRKDADMRLMEYEQKIAEKEDRVGFEDKDESLEQKRSELAKKIRARLTDDRMDEIRNEDELERFIYELDKDGVIRDQEMTLLKQQFNEYQEDRAFVRRLTIQRIETGQELDIERERREFEREQRIADANTDSIIHKMAISDDVDDAMSGLKIKAEMDRIKREDAAANQAMDMDRAQKEADIEAQRLKDRSGASDEALISMAEGRQGDQLSEIARMKQAKNLTEEQLMALGAKDSVAVAEAQKEKYRSDLIRDNFEERMKDKDDFMDRMQAMEDKNRDQMERILDKSLEQMGSTASTRAQSHSAPGTTVISGGGYGQPVVIGGGQPQGQAQPPEKEKVVICSSCNAEQPLGTKFCTNCGEKISG